MIYSQKGLIIYKANASMICNFCEIDDIFGGTNDSWTENTPAEIIYENWSEDASGIKLLTMSEYIYEDMGKSLLNDCLEIKRILVASIKTAKDSENDR